jgi:hypothetical protein
MRRKNTTIVLAISTLAAAAIAGACAGAANTDVTANTSGESALSIAYASATDSSGTLMCAPTQSQIELCAGLAAGDDCTLTSSDGAKTWSGTCRTSLDGAVIACSPKPPAPPAELVEACSGKAAGDACTVEEAFGGSRDGTCHTGRGGSTLVCGRVHEPPQAAVDACANLAAGDACTLPGRPSGSSSGGSASGGSAHSGVCSLGPGSTGTLACTPAQQIVSPSEKACDGLEAGATCSVGRGHLATSGTCIAPAGGGASICQLPCDSLGGFFKPGPGPGHDGSSKGGRGPGHDGPSDPRGATDGGHGGPCHRDGGSEAPADAGEVE